MNKGLFEINGTGFDPSIINMFRFVFYPSLLVIVWYNKTYMRVHKIKDN